MWYTLHVAFTYNFTYNRVDGVPHEKTVCKHFGCERVDGAVLLLKSGLCVT